MQFLDRLYGQIEIDDKYLPLFRTRELTRLRHLSLSAVPSWTLPMGTCASKFEHTIGVAHLAQVVGRKKEFQSISQDLFLAALAHDIGTPPFSHISERFQTEVMGKDHELAVVDMLGDSELGREMSKLGSDVTTVANYVVGRSHPYSDVMNSSMDIDNLDNTLRFGVSCGLMAKAKYQPTKLAESFTIWDGQIALSGEIKSELQGWEATRQEIYAHVYSPTNLASAAMLKRALEFAFHGGELTKQYFHMQDEEAWGYLAQNCNKQTQRIIERLDHWQFFQPIYVQELKTLAKEKAHLFTSVMHESQLANQLAEELHIEPTEISVILAKNKGFKQIHFPLFDTQGRKIYFTSMLKPSWIAQVYVDPRHKKKAAEVKEFMDDFLA